MAEGIANARIQFVWLELPESPQAGNSEVRLFLAQNDPPEPVIPNPNELRCLLTTDRETAMLGPERVPFTFDTEAAFSGAYTYRACPDCVECYMNWDYTLEFSGTVSGDTVHLEIAIRHFGLNVQGSYVRAELTAASNHEGEPRITCDRMIACRGIVFADWE